MSDTIGSLAIGQHLKTIFAFYFQQVTDIAQETGHFSVGEALGHGQLL